jgi:hypothetical protein
MPDYMPLLNDIALAVGGAVASVIALFVEAGQQMAENPRALARDIALQLIMFTITTVALGSLYHRFVLKPREQRELKLAADRRAALMEPFRRMLVMRLASAHGGLYDALTHFEDWSGNWGRPRIRSLSSAVAHICAELSNTAISNADLLQEEEQKSVGKYSAQLFALQRKLEEIEKSIDGLNADTIGALRGTIVEANAAINQIAESFDPSYKAQVQDLLWDDHDGTAVEENLLVPLTKRAEKIAARAAEAAAPPPAPAMAAE